MRSSSFSFRRFIWQGISVISIAIGLVACGGDSYESYISSAKGFMEKSDHVAAAIQLRNAIAEKPNSGEARFLLGKALLSGGDFAGAAIELTKAADNEYPKEQVAPLLARLLLADEQPKLLIDRYSKVSLDSPQADADLQTSLSAAYEMLGNSSRSRQVLDSVLNKQPDFPPALLLKSRFAAREGQLQEALGLVEKTLTADPRSAEGWRLKGDYLVNAKAPVSEAMAAYRKAIEVKNTDAGAYRGILDLLIAAQDFDALRAEIESMRKVLAGHPETLRGELWLAHRDRDFQKAREIAQHLLKLKPNHVQGQFLAGAAEFELRSFAKAEDHLSKALSMAPSMVSARQLLAQTYLSSGQPAKAVSLLAPWTQGPNISPDVLALAAEAHLQSGDLKQAEKLFKQASAKDSTLVRGKVVQAMVAIHGGKSQEGIDQLHSVVAQDKGSSADLALIRTHMQRKEFDKALAAIDGLERKTTGQPFAENLRGLVSLARNNVADARRRFERALEMDPAYFPAAATLSTLDLAERKYELAASRFNGVLAKDPKNHRAMLAKAEIREKAGAPANEVLELLRAAVAANPDAPQSRIALFQYHLRNNDLKSATTVAQEASTRLPDSPEALDALGQIQLLNGSANQAVQTYLRMVERADRSPVSLLRLAEAYVKTNNLKAAELSVRQALELAPTYVVALRRHAELLMGLKRPREAMASVRSLQKSHPDDSVGDLLEGDIHAAEKNWVAAAKSYRTGLNKLPTTELATRLHVALRATGDSTGAERMAAEWKKAHAEDLAFLIHVGDDAAVRGDFKMAESSYLQVINKRPRDAQVLNNLAWVTHKQARPDALGFAEKAVSIDPGNPGYLDTLAAILDGESQLKRAIEVQRKAVDLLPTNPVLRLRLAKLFAKAGDKQNARVNLEELLQFKDPFPGDSEIQPLLRQL
ncbi:MAG: PEP-CTERM system TPR-repeat protein PrsT [Dechloromonas sp.]|nr:PEP-CTERM system TPR-repeat protein PrsT [Dechloromonas sp.]